MAQALRLLMPGPFSDIAAFVGFMLIATLAALVLWLFGVPGLVSCGLGIVIVTGSMASALHPVCWQGRVLAAAGMATGLAVIVSSFME